MKKSKYYKTAIKLIPQEIIDKYELNNKQSNGYIYTRVKKRIYELVKAGIIAHEALKEHLKHYGFACAIITQGLCKHQDR